MTEITGVILEFRGPHYFLSNYYTSPFIWRNIEFQSGEQAFAYAKTFFAKSRAVEYQRQILETNAPGEAKKLGRRLSLDVVEWDKFKVTYMREIVHAKFLNGDPIMVHNLLNTEAKMLIEGNDWGDKFWGRVRENDKWVGLNVLGVILMEERGWWSRGSVSRP